MDLIDFRTKLHPRAHAVLTAVARASGKDMNEIVRELLDKWADDEVHKAEIVMRLVREDRPNE